MAEMYAFLDLDNTLVCSPARQLPGESYSQAGIGTDGAPASFISEKNRTLLGILRRSGQVIPVTGRDRTSFSRLQVNFSSWKILAHGTLLLDPENKVPANWWEFTGIQKQQEALRETLESLVMLFPDTTPEAPRIRMHTEASLQLHISLKGSPALLKQARQQIEAHIPLPTGFRLIHNPRVIAILPPGTGKLPALQWLRQHHLAPDALCLGFGDSLSDLDFMTACDFAAFPPGSQIHHQVQSPNQK